MYGSRQTNRLCVKGAAIFKVMLTCAALLMLSFAGCSTYRGQIAAMGGKGVEELPSNYWQSGLTLDVTIFVQDPMEGVVSQNEELLHLLKRQMEVALTPPQGVDATYYIIPVYAIRSGENIEEFPADRHMEINLAVLPLDQELMINAHCVLYAPGKMPNYSDRHERWTEAERKGLFRQPSGVVDIFRLMQDHKEHKRELRQEQAAGGRYYSPQIIQRAAISVGEAGRLSWKEEQAFMKLVKSVAEEVNRHCF